MAETMVTTSKEESMCKVWSYNKDTKGVILFYYMRGTEKNHLSRRKICVVILVGYKHYIIAEFCATNPVVNLNRLNLGANVLTKISDSLF